MGSLFWSNARGAARVVCLGAALWSAGSVIDAALAADSPSPASGATDSTEALRQELQLEEQKIRALEQRLAADEAARAAAPASSAPAPTVAVAAPNALLGSFGGDGYALQSADGANSLRFRGNVSIDDRNFSDSYTPTTADTWLIRKVRPTLEGTIAGRYDFRIMPDFGQGKTIVQDAWADARVQPWLVFTFGKFKVPVGLERLQLEQFARFIEPALTSDLLPYRDLGAQVSGNLAAGLLSYSFGQFDGAVDAGSTDGNSTPDANSTGHFTWEGRLYSKPFLHTDWSALKGLGFGIAGSYVNYAGVATTTTTTSLLASYKTTGQQSLFSYRSNNAPTGAVYNNATIAQGVERRWVPQFYYAYRIVSLLGEYVDEHQQVQRTLSATSVRADTLHDTAWQLQAAVFLTGENEAYDSTTPRRDFGYGQGGPGAWELVARLHEVHFDQGAFDGGSASFANPSTAPLAARAFGSGVNWYLNRNFKIQLDYEITRFEGGAVVGNRPDERVLTSQFALIF